MLICVALVLALWLRGLDALAPFWMRLSGQSITAPVAWSRLYAALALFQAASIPVLLWASGQYRLLRDPAGNWSYNRVLLSVTASFASLLAILFILGVPRLPRTVLGLDFALILLGASAWRSIWHRRVRNRHEQGRGLRNVVLVGSGRLQQQVAAEFVQNPLHGRRVVGFLTDDPSNVLDHLPAAWADRTDLHTSPGVLDLSPVVARAIQDQPRHILAPIATLEPQHMTDALDGLLVEEAYIGPDVPPEIVRQVLTLCQARGIGVHLIPDHYPELGIQPQAWSAGPFTFLDIHQRPISRLGWMAKRGMDVVASAAAMVLLSPVILACVLAVKAQDVRGPAFYGGLRVGLRGRQFRQWKFATMVRDADAHRGRLAQDNAREGPWFQLDEGADPRITRVGRFLRKYSLNDIPQFWNVFVGDMSLVGPRPLAVDEAARFIDYDFRYYRAFDVKPGITGLWQVSDRMNPSFEYRIEKDFRYIQEWNFFLDLKILFLTPWAMLRGGR